MIDREVRDATDLYALVSQYVPLQSRGNFGVAPCPFHGPERTASFRVNISGRYAGRFKCFGCDAQGDAIDFLARIEWITQFEAVKRLAEQAGISFGAQPPNAPSRSARLAGQARCIWWRRDRWKRQRLALDRLLANGPPELDSPEFIRAEYYGQLLRHLEKNCSNVSGYHSGWTRSDAFAYTAFLRSKIIAGMRMASFLSSGIYPPERDSATLCGFVRNLPY